MKRYKIVDGELVEDAYGEVVLYEDVLAEMSKIARTCLAQLNATTSYIESFVKE